MKKTKALFLTLALVFTGALATTATGCDTFNKIFGKESSNSESSIDNGGFENSEENLISIGFEKSEVSVYQYEDVTLVCKAKGTGEAIVYTSEDESVASVDANGKVTAKDKIGSVKITATVEGVSATCTVKVEKSPYHPQIILNSTEYTVEEYTVDSDGDFYDGSDYDTVVSFRKRTAAARTVKQICRMARMTQNAMADYFGIPRRTFGNWCTGERECLEYTRLMMQEILGLYRR